MTESYRPLRAVGLHFIGDTPSGLKERSEDVINAAVAMGRLRHYDWWFISGRKFRGDRSKAVAEKMADGLMEAGIPEDRIILDTKHPSTTSFELGHFIKESDRRGMDELDTITSRTHEPTFKDLISRHESKAQVRVYAFEDILETVPQSQEVRDRYAVIFEDRKKDPTEIKWRKYEKTKEKSRIIKIGRLEWEKIGVGRLKIGVAELMEKITNLVSYVYRPDPV